jgi:hypothetical protein
VDEPIFSKWGLDIFKRSGRFYARFDVGHISDKMIEVEITEQEAERAQINEKEAGEVILPYARSYHQANR